jgi:hypothetical protein
MQWSMIKRRTLIVGSEPRHVALSESPTFYI